MRSKIFILFIFPFALYGQADSSSSIDWGTALERDSLIWAGKLNHRTLTALDAGPVGQYFRWRNKMISLREVSRKEYKLYTGLLLNPLKDQPHRISSRFGYRVHPITRKRKKYEGIALVASAGTKVYSTMKGIVESVSTSKEGYGNRVVIKNGNVRTCYSHLQSFVVNHGQRVKHGQLIGYVGNTGYSTGPHLMYQIKVGNSFVNPLFYMREFTRLRQLLDYYGDLDEEN